jgi:hypothetical protein
MNLLRVLLICLLIKDSGQWFEKQWSSIDYLQYIILVFFFYWNESIDNKLVSLRRVLSCLQFVYWIIGAIKSK